MKGSFLTEHKNDSDNKGELLNYLSESKTFLPPLVLHLLSSCLLLLFFINS